jgi:signal transduction histidine kinase
MGQSLAALILGLKSLAHVYQPNDQAHLQFQHLQNIANDLAREVHSLALDLRPTALDDLGLVEALSNYLEVWSARWQISADFHSQGFTGRRLPPHLETTIYRIAQQALTNIARHAHAQTASLILEWVDDRVTVIIEDDGCGFDVEAVTKSQEKEQRLGLLGMEERVALVRGGLTIESAIGRGTSVYVRIPISFQPNGELAQWTN